MIDDSFSQFLSVISYPGQELYWGRGWWRGAGTKTSTLMSEQWHLLLWSGRKASCILYWQFYKGRINIWALCVFEFMETLANISLNSSSKLKPFLSKHCLELWVYYISIEFGFLSFPDVQEKDNNHCLISLSQVMLTKILFLYW